MASQGRASMQHFLDSGAHSIFMQRVIRDKQTDFYETQEFWDYVDRYAEFIKTNLGKGIDYYVNCDAIYNPKMSWKVLKYLENTHKLNPVPVIHAWTPMKWLERHLEDGYEFIGLGGLGQFVKKETYFTWADQVYHVLCNNPQRLPCVKTHGFAITSQEVLLRYPWYSVDSTAWCKRAGYGKIFVPHRRKGKFVFDEFNNLAYDLFVADDSPYTKRRGQHINTIGAEQKKVVLDWLKSIDIKYGRRDKKGNIIEEGVSNTYRFRCIANLCFFAALRDSLPPWPWPFVQRRIERSLF